MITNEELAYKLQLMSERIDKLQTQVDNIEIKDYLDFMDAVDKRVGIRLRIRKQVEDLQKQMLTPVPHEYKLKDDVEVCIYGQWQKAIYLYVAKGLSSPHTVWWITGAETMAVNDNDIRPLKDNK